MNILAFTTRDYYDIVNSKCWDIIECPQLIDFISNLYDGDTVNKDRNVRKFFKEDDEAVGFWEGYRGTFTMRKHKNADVYIIPCIPRNHLYGEGKCKSQKVRQDYIGTFLNCVLSRLKDVNADDIFVAVHDLDVFANNDERNMSDEDLIPDTILSRLIINGSIKRDHIFGFQHDNDNGNLYSLFNQKLGAENLPEDFYTNITKKIIESSEKKTNRGLLEYEGVSSKKIATPQPITPILFTFTIGSNGKFVCTMPDSYNDDCYHEYYILVKAIKEALENKIFESIPGDYSTFLLIHHIDDIRGCAKRQGQYVFGQNYFKEDEAFFPIIHFCDASLKELTAIYRYASVIDCSIWNYYVQINRSEDNSPISFVDGVQLLNVISNIARNSSRHLYNLVVARESADLVARMTYASYIKRFPETEGHRDYVAPFLFHSECEMKQEYEKIQKNGLITKHNWRFLLLDDHAMDSLSIATDSISNDLSNDSDRKKFDSKSRKLVFSSKLYILKEVIGRIQDFNISWRYFNGEVWVDSHNRPTQNTNEVYIDIWCVTSIKDALNVLRDYKFDIIFLDYLLGKKSLLEQDFSCGEIEMNQECQEEYNQYVQSSVREYGYHLLKRIKKIQQNKSRDFRGPFGRQFFMFISAFTTAVEERLRAEGLNRNEKYWYIGEGACPTNTPRLFLYNLLKSMDKRLDDSGVDKLSPRGIFDVVNSIFGDIEKVRSRANDKFQDVLNLHYLYRKMLKDVEIPQDSIFNTKGSVLITNFITKNVNLGGLLEHLTQLIHLTAFGTVRQWPEMWEEYIYFKAQFDLNQFKEQNNESDFYKLCDNIESYILELKSDIG